jgi:hypothetical protein
VTWIVEPKLFGLFLNLCPLFYLKIGQPMFYSCKRKPLQLNLNSIVWLKSSNGVAYHLLPILV